MATCSFIKERKQTAGGMGRVIQYVSHHGRGWQRLPDRCQLSTLTEQQPNVQYTMPVQTVEQLENVLQHTLALNQETYQAIDVILSD